MWDFPLFPDRASALARRVDAVFFFELAVAVVMTIVICVLILYYATKYRRGSRADRSNPITHSVKLETAWVVVPLAIMMVMFADVRSTDEMIALLERRAAPLAGAAE